VTLSGCQDLSNRGCRDSYQLCWLEGSTTKGEHQREKRIGKRWRNHITAGCLRNAWWVHHGYEYLLAHLWRDWESKGKDSVKRGGPSIEYFLNPFSLGFGHSVTGVRIPPNGKRSRIFSYWHSIRGKIQPQNSYNRECVGKAEVVDLPACLKSSPAAVDLDKWLKPFSNCYDEDSGYCWDLRRSLVVHDLLFLDFNRGCSYCLQTFIGAINRELSKDIV